MKSVLKVLIIWVTLLAVPLQGFASATMSLCAPPPAAAQHDHEAMTGDDAFSLHAQDEHAGHAMHADHRPAAHHHAGKCAACGTCGACVSMAPPSVAVLPASAISSVTAPFDQRILPSVDLALPERPPRV